jgi:hypothetical protein
MRFAKQLILPLLAVLLCLTLHACKDRASTGMPQVIGCPGPFGIAGTQTQAPTDDQFKAQFAECFAPGFCRRQSQKLPPGYNFDALHYFHPNNDDFSTAGSIFVDDSGAIILAYTDPYVAHFGCGLAPAAPRNAPNARANPSGYVNPAGDFVIPPQFDQAQTFREGRAGVSKNDLWGFIDTQGKQITPLKYRMLDPYENGIARAYLPDTSNDEIIYLDLQGQPVLKPAQTPPAPPALTATRDPNAPPGTVPLWGYTDPTGNWVLKPQYYMAHPFSEGLAAVAVRCDAPKDWKNEKLPSDYPFAAYAYIDTTGKIVIPAEFSSADPFNNGIARVKRNPWHEALIDKSGKQIFGFTRPLRANAVPYMNSLPLPANP